MKLQRIPVLALATLSTIAFTGCYAEIHEDDFDDNPSDTWHDDSSGSPSEASEPPVNKLCRTQDCKRVPVYVVYTLNQDLGKDNTVVLEAFDNSRFEGSPVATASITGFDASGAGALSEGTLALTPGKYFLRAFITNQANAAAPYEYGGMRLVSNRPVGYFGAASGAHSILVDDASDSTAPITVKLNYLFQSNEKEAPTDANLRILFSLAPEKTVPASRKLRIELRDSTDLATTPKSVYTLPSDSLLVSNHPGTTEFVARDLVPGKYTILTYIDTNDNEFPDAGELQQSWQSAGSVGYLNIVPKRTETISLQLQ
jgi:hypothetical protein